MEEVFSHEDTATLQVKSSLDYRLKPCNDPTEIPPLYIQLDKKRPKKHKNFMSFLPQKVILIGSSKGLLAVEATFILVKRMDILPRNWSYTFAIQCQKNGLN
ncbi:hypothetical protein COLO4_20680 [Corchorus olitorius]|uniref:Uncharacterized protein n=1 Tax=Corchorus olitorius TaxID=93759 RepID=A0A1R3IXM5_9ROSI|nr:hypothetical protein COLO4_20680 [Corchorus olitorius]